MAGVGRLELPGKRVSQQKEKSSLILHGPNPNFIDIKGHLGLGFWTEPI